MTDKLIGNHYCKVCKTTHLSVCSNRDRLTMTSPLLTPEEISNYNEVAFHGDGSSYEYMDVHGLCHAQLVKVVTWLEENMKEVGADYGNPYRETEYILSAEGWQSLKELVK